MTNNTEELTNQGTLQAMSPEDVYDAKELEIANLTTAFEGATGDTPTQLMLAKQVLEAQAELPGLLLAKNSGAIQAAKDDIFRTLVGLVANSSYEELTGNEIKTIVFVRAEEKETDKSGPLYELAVNPTKTPTGKRAKRSGTSTARGKAGDMVSRIGPTGVVETYTIKDMVQGLASEKLRGQSLYSKSAWSSLYPKVNAELVAAGENEFLPVLDEVTPPAEVPAPPPEGEQIGVTV